MLTSADRAAVRKELARIFATKPYQTEAAKPGNKTDAFKVAEAFAGRKRPDCSSPYFLGFQRLALMAPAVVPTPPPDPPPPDPPPVSALDPLWRRDAVFCIGLSSFSGTKRVAAKVAGFTAVYVQLLHGTPGSYDLNVAEIEVFRREGWIVAGWGTYGQGSDPETDGRRAAEIVRQLGLAGWKANGEAWAEDAPGGGPQNAWKTEAFLDGWRAGGSPAPLGWSVLSSDTANFARGFAYPVALSVPGADIDIQVYGSTVPTYTVAAGLGMLAKANVPVARTSMTFDVNAEGVGPFADYRTWGGPRRVWTGDAARPATFEALG